MYYRPSQETLLQNCAFGMHDLTCLHLSPVICNHFHSSEHWKDPLHQLLYGHRESAQIIINQPGKAVKNLTSNNNRLLSSTKGCKKRHNGTMEVESVLFYDSLRGHILNDCEIVELLWNPPRPLPKNLMTQAFWRGTSFFPQLTVKLLHFTCKVSDFFFTFE